MCGCVKCFGCPQSNGELERVRKMATIKDELMRNPILSSMPQEIDGEVKAACLAAGVSLDDFMGWLYENGFKWSRFATSADTPEGLKAPYVADYRFAARVLSACYS